MTWFCSIVRRRRTIAFLRSPTVAAVARFRRPKSSRFKRSSSCLSTRLSNSNSTRWPPPTVWSRLRRRWCACPSASPSSPSSASALALGESGELEWQLALQWQLAVGESGELEWQLMKRSVRRGSLRRVIDASRSACFELSTGGMSVVAGCGCGR